MAELKALLLTDVVDSTKLSEQLGDARMAEIWAAHDELARELLPAFDGLEIDKTDGFLLIFDSVKAGLDYAMAYHAALRGLTAELGVPFAARAGLHCGEVILRKNPAIQVARGAKPIELEGIAKPTAARVMSVASAGQTLLSDAAIIALGITNHRVMSHGHWRMKGRSEPIELFEVGDESAPFKPPPDGAKVYRVIEKDGDWLPVNDVPHTLPRERDAFIGRESDLERLATLVEGGAALITVLGPGGCGKTRLTRRFGWRWLGDFPGGVWFCDLSEAHELEGVASAIARTLDVPLTPGDPIEQLGTVLLNRGRTLILLDNFEQIAEHASATVGAWLERAPKATFMISSRVLLSLPGEQVLPLEPLPLTTDAVALFEARGQARKPGFTVNDRNRADVEAIVKTLDGLPLAIELAAARLSVLPPAKLRKRLKDRFKLLAGKGASARQATLRAAIDWSWDLLEAWEKSAMAQLSAFEGGFTLEHAEQVVAIEDDWPDAPWVMDLVQALVDKSLLRAWEPEGSDELRFGMYTSMQEYAAEKLRDPDAIPAGEEGPRDELLEETLRRHLECFAAYGEDDARAELIGPDAIERRAAVGRELENLVAAAGRGDELDEPELAARAALASADIFRVQGPLQAGVQVLEQASEDVDDDDLLAMLALERGDLLRLSGETQEAAEALEEAIGADDAVVQARAKVRLALVRASQRQPDDAKELLADALKSAKRARNKALQAEALRGQGIVATDTGDAELGLEKLRAALKLRRRLGDRRGEGMELGNVAVVLRRMGELEEAAEAAEEAAEAHREVGNAMSLGSTLLSLAMIQHMQGLAAEAEATYRAALEVQRRVGNRRAESITAGNRGVALQDLGRLTEAEDALSDAIDIAEEVEAKQVECVHSAALADVMLERDEPEDAEIHLERAMEIAEAFGAKGFIATFKILESRIKLADDDLDAAVEALAEAAPVIEERGSPDDRAKLAAQQGQLALAQDDEDAAREALERAEEAEATAADALRAIARLNEALA